MESGGRLGKGSMRVLNRLATIAAESDGVEKRVCVRRAQEALSVARVRGNGYVWTRCRRWLMAAAVASKLV